MRIAAFFLAAAFGLATAGAFAQSEPVPEPATRHEPGKSISHAAHRMVVAAHPLAAEAGLSILQKGGAAIDAAIAVQLVLNLVEPQSSGIGGGAFLLHWDAEAEILKSYDGRETAPAAARPERFITKQGNPQSFEEAVVGGKSVGTPGLLRMLALAHRAHGKLPWHDLFEDAIRLAEEGFRVTPRLAQSIAKDRWLGTQAAARRYFYGADGKPLGEGALLVNKPFADTLRKLAAGGAEIFYSGDIAKAIVGQVKAAQPNPGDLTLADLAAYRPLEREPLCGPYRVYIVCGMGPPSSGGLAILQMLAYLEPFPMADFGPNSAEALHLLAEAARLAFADRNRYVADPAFVAVPIAGLLAPDYLRARGAAIDPAKSMGRAQPGEPKERQGFRTRPWGDDADSERPATSHVSVVDAAGNAVSFTTSIENAFGSRLMVGGFLLNNQLTDFAFRPRTETGPVANGVEPGKRPRSSMSPTLVFRDEAGKRRLVAVLGSPGGARIIPFVARSLVAMLDWNMSPAEAVALPHVANLNGDTELGADTPLAGSAGELEKRGHLVQIAPMTSGLHAIRVGPAGLEGGADPRREGVALGD